MNQKKIYQHLWAAHDDTKWDDSLSPRSPDLLFDVAMQAGINKTWTVLDVGCGRGHHVCELSHRFGCQTFGLEPLDANMKSCADSAKSWNVADQVKFVRGKNAGESVRFEHL